MAAGKVTAKEAWLIPKDAFVEIVNGHLYHGVLEKRKGYSQFGQVIRNREKAYGEGNYGEGPYGQGTMPALYPVMGIFNYYKSGDKKILACSTRGAALYNTATKVFDDITDVSFTGTDSDFFNFCQWQDNVYFTNNVDQIRKFTGSAPISKHNIDLDVEGGPDNDVDTCMIIVVYEGRLVLLNTIERGTRYPRRARWLDINNPDSAKDANYKDCSDTADEIQAACVIQNILYVWFKGKQGSIWRLTYTGDTTDPFRWDRVAPQDGCSARMSLVSRKDMTFGIGQARIVVFDGLTPYNADEKIPNITLSWNKTKVGYCYGHDKEDKSQIWLSYASSGVDLPDSILVMNFDEGSFSDYEMPAHCFGSAEIQDNLVLDNPPDGFSTDDYPAGFSLDSDTIQGGYPITLMGCRDGSVYQIDESQSDNGSVIPFSATTGRLNPFVEQGRRAHLGWIDFLVDNAIDVNFNVSMYMNYDSLPYRTSLISCYDANNRSDKIWRRLYVNAVADFHQWQIANSGINNTPRIHCIIPYFAVGAKTYG
jgi:hypothetical protein